MPKLFRMTKGGKLSAGIFKGCPLFFSFSPLFFPPASSPLLSLAFTAFSLVHCFLSLLSLFLQGETINTPSMLATEDYLDALGWAKSLGGYKALVARADSNLAVIESMVSKSPWLEFLSGPDPTVRSHYFCDIWEKWGRHIWEKRVVGICFVFPSYSRGALEHECLPFDTWEKWGRHIWEKMLVGICFVFPSYSRGALEHECLPLGDRHGRRSSQGDGGAPREGGRRARHWRIPLRPPWLPNLVWPDG